MAIYYEKNYNYFLFNFSGLKNIFAKGTPSNEVMTQLPGWVAEMNKPVIDYSLLIQKFNDFRKDKKNESIDSEPEFVEE